jgi:predicted PurR-regulated permease PerM
MKNKKAQMKMGETIAVLLVFFIILFFGIMFYSRMQSSEIKETVQEIEEKSSTDIAQKIQFLPELKCTSSDVTRSLCIDNLKAKSFSNISKDNTAYYQSIFGSTKIEYAQVYPGLTNYTILYEGPSSSQYITTLMPISLFNPLPYPGRYTIGLLRIRYYLFS